MCTARFGTKQKKLHLFIGAQVLIQRPLRDQLLTCGEDSRACSQECPHNRTPGRLSCLHNSPIGRYPQLEESSIHCHVAFINEQF